MTLLDVHHLESVHSSPSDQAVLITRRIAMVGLAMQLMATRNREMQILLLVAVQPPFTRYQVFNGACSAQVGKSTTEGSSNLHPVESSGLVLALAK